MVKEVEISLPQFTSKEKIDEIYKEISQNKQPYTTDTHIEQCINILCKYYKKSDDNEFGHIMKLSEAVNNCDDEDRKIELKAKLKQAIKKLEKNAEDYIKQGETIE